MPQFALYQNANPRTKGTIPYLLDAQSNVLDDLATRVVIPVARLNTLGIRPITRLMPSAEIDGEVCILLTPQLAGVGTKELGQPAGDLSHLRAEIIAALDLLFTGF